jgi:hypothetical protein
LQALVPDKEDAGVIAGGVVGMMGRDKEERVPYSAIASVTLMIAR